MDTKLLRHDGGVGRHRLGHEDLFRRECGKASRDFGSLLTAFTLDELASFERATVTRPLAADFSNSS